MIYKVHQHSDDIEVFLDDNIYMMVKRTFNFWGKMTSVFYINEKIILKSTYDIILFRKYLTITYQDLDANLILLAGKGNYLLEVNNLKLQLKRHYFKNPVYTILDKGIVLGAVETKLNTIIVGTVLYTISLECKKENEIYCLIRFLIELSDIIT